MADFLYNVPRSFLLHIVRKADAKKGYDDTEVRVSVLLDVDRGAVKSQRDYARIWGQSRKWVRYRWDDIVADVVDLCTSYGRQLDGPLAQKLPPEWVGAARREHGAQVGAQQGPTKGPAGAHETAPVEQEARNGAQVGAQQGPTKGPHTKHPISLSPSLHRPTAPARDEDFDPVEVIHETYAAIPQAHPWHGFRLGIMQLDRVRAEVADPAALAEALRVWTEREYNPRNLDGFLDRYRADVAALEADAGDEGGAGGALPAPGGPTASGRGSGRSSPNGDPAAGGRRRGGRATGLRSTPEHRKSASDRRSEYGYDDASRDVDEALADLIAADAARRGAPPDRGGDDG